MYKTIGQIKKALIKIDIKGKTSAQLTNYANLENWMAGKTNTDAVSSQNAKLVAKAIKNIQKDKTPMSDITKSKIKNLNDAISDYITSLYERWQDEKDYEDWGDYVAVIKKRFETEIVKNNMTNAVYYSCGKRPFGVKFDFEGFRITIYTNSTHCGWKWERL